MPNFSYRLRHISLRTASPFVVAAVVMGVVVVVLVHAAAPLAAFEAESGTLSGGASVVSVTGQSGTGIVKFGTGATPTPTPSGTCDLNATTSSFAAQISAATAGQTVCLAAGNYGTWNGTTKAITVKAATGAVPSMSLNFVNSSTASNFTLDGVTTDGGIVGSSTSGNAPKNITIKHTTFTETVDLQFVASGIVFDSDIFNNIDDNAACNEYGGRFQNDGDATNSAAIVVQNSTFNGGNKDGIQTDGPMTIKNNVFTNIKEKSASDCQHSDSIQGVGASGVIVTGNILGNGSDGIVSFDGSANWTITGNACYNLDRGACISLYSDKNSVVQHNATTTAMDVLEIDHKSADPVGSGTVYKDNVGSLSSANGSTVTGNTNNLYSGASSPNINGNPVFVGGSAPTTLADFKLTAASPGHAAASDGTDVGVN